MANKLTRKQEVFVAEYLSDFDGKRSAIAAGYSPRTAESQASQLLKNPKVSQAIAQETGKRLQKLSISADYVLQNIVEVGERCLQKRWPKLVRQGRKMVPLTEEVEDPETGDVVTAEVYQFDSFGALKAQELLGKYLKLFTDKVEHSGKVTLEKLIHGTE